MIQLCSQYESFSSTNLILLYFSLKVVEWPRGIDPKTLPLCGRTHFKFLLQLSIKSRQSLGLYSKTPSFFRRPSTLLLYTISFSLVKYGKNSSRFFLQKMMRVTDFKRFFSLSLEASSPEDSLKRFKSLAKSFSSPLEKSCGDKKMRENGYLLWITTVN